MDSELPVSAVGAPPMSVQVWGPGALFTRPELKAERVTYPVMTPTAAVGVLEAIFWKPEFSWRPVAIDVLRSIQQFTQRRNETTDLVPMADAVRGRRVDAAGNRAQRNAVCLRDVAYRIYAHVDLADHATKPEGAYRAQFERRVERGQCFHQPYLGTREFSAHFAPVDDTPRVSDSADLGIMLHRVHYPKPENGEDDGEHEPTMWFSWFTAQLESGRMRIPTHGIAAEMGAER